MHAHLYALTCVHAHTHTKAESFYSEWNHNSRRSKEQRALENVSVFDEDTGNENYYFLFGTGKRLKKRKEKSRDADVCACMHVCVYNDIQRA